MSSFLSGILYGSSTCECRAEGCGGAGGTGGSLSGSVAFGEDAGASRWPVGSSGASFCHESSMPAAGAPPSMSEMGIVGGSVGLESLVSPSSSPLLALMATHVSTCDLCDAYKASSDWTFRVLPPVFRSYGGRKAFHGTVVTAKCYEDNTSVKQLLESPGEERVLVVDGGGSLRRALIGGNIAAAAAKNGWAGAVVDGCVRDVAELAASDVGLFALANVPMPTDRKAPGLVEVPVTIQGVLIRPGEWLCADEDGIVVMPQAPSSAT
ncbi:ribonuclease E inhibitor RraA/Dimethylmenaquinone methyltransferase [Hyaloraphidium curvatum]|nr:ribonuclease E inhibitor RraA/Dimethylmenaquinone methyltransferase [Hyaloraphidium curvatum]